MNRDKIKSIVGEKWSKVINATLDNSTVELMVDGVRNEINKYTIYPPIKNVWRAFELCDYDVCKVVMVGQDPYLQGEATGLCFDVDSNYKNKLPPSAIHFNNAYNDYKPTHFNTEVLDGNFTKWAAQGVLMLNSCFTVRKGEPNSHDKYWRSFITTLLTELHHRKDLIFITIGAIALSRCKSANIPDDNIIRLEHPALATKQGRPWRHKNFFNKVNERLGKNKIEW